MVSGGILDFLEAEHCQGWSGVHSPAETSWAQIRLQMDFVGICISSRSGGCSNFNFRNLFGLSVMGLGRRSSGARSGLRTFHCNVVSQHDLLLVLLHIWISFRKPGYRAHMWVHCQSC